MPPSPALSKCFLDVGREGTAFGVCGETFLLFPILLELHFAFYLHKACQATSLSFFLSKLPKLSSFSFSKDVPAKKVQIFGWHYVLNPPECSGRLGRVVRMSGRVSSPLMLHWDHSERQWSMLGIGQCLHFDSSRAVGSSEPQSTSVSTMMKLKTV